MLNVRVGDECKSCLRGWGKVVKSGEEMGFLVDFGSSCDWFWSDGKRREDDIIPEIVEVYRKKWEPETGEWFLNGMGDILPLTKQPYYNKKVTEGRSYKTKKQAEKAHEMIRPFQRLVAWVFENVPDYDPEDKKNYAVVLKDIDGKWMKVVGDSFGIEVTMPELVAEILAEKLNSGEVEL